MTVEANRELVVVKVGTDVLTRQDSFEWPTLDRYSFANIGRQVNELADGGVDVVLTTSAAIIGGHEYTHEERTYGKDDTEAKQRMACLGQTTLMTAWQEGLSPRNAGQVLFTKKEIEDGEGEELKSLSLRLLADGDIPVANENDALSHEQISFGDNDTLAARYAVLLGSTGVFSRVRVVVLSDVHGVYEDIEDEGSVVELIDDIKGSEHLLVDKGEGFGTGGMAGKFAAARILNAAGIEMRLGHGKTGGAIEKLLADEMGTLFMDENAVDEDALVPA
ncbi:MAG TPA: hypothetical protein VFW77_01620 [Candidatus Saccharimonadales bacterium]|nr:hypothetical protein [Candidatus Saccharimonadales bacterium]